MMAQEEALDAICELLEASPGKAMRATKLFSTLYEEYDVDKISNPKKFVQAEGAERLIWEQHKGGGTCEVQLVESSSEGETNSEDEESSNESETNSEDEESSNESETNSEDEDDEYGQEADGGANRNTIHWNIQAPSAASASVTTPQVVSSSPPTVRSSEGHGGARGRHSIGTTAAAFTTEMSLQSKIETKHTNAFDHFASIVDINDDDDAAADAATDFQEVAVPKRYEQGLVDYFADIDLGTERHRDRRRDALFNFDTKDRHQRPRDCGLFGSATTVGSTTRIGINVHDPFCLIAVGVQGSGKSHSIGTVIENCTVAAAGVVELRSAMPVLVLHYDDAVMNPCECASLMLPSIRLVRQLEKEGRMTHADAQGELRGVNLGLPVVQKMVVLVSPTYFKQRKDMYKNMPRTTVRPLVFNWGKLQAAQLKLLMGLKPGGGQLYVNVMLDMLRRFQRNCQIPAYNEFKAKITEAMPSVSQSGPLQQRLDVLDALVAESYSPEDHEQGWTAVDLAELIEPGTVVMADLTDPMLDADTANGIFQVLLEQFRDVPSKHGKLCVFDEAHKYLSGAKSGGLADSIVDSVRQMRHYGLRVAISTQSPLALPPEVLELTSIAILHKFHSLDWYDYLSKKLPLPASAFGDVQRLNPGKALVFASTNSVSLGADPVAPAMVECDAGGGEREEYDEVPPQLDPNVFLVQMRQRLTADGGASRTNKRQ